MRTAPAPALLQPGRNCSGVATAHRVAVLIDAEAYFRAFAQAAQRAQRSIRILAWDFDSRIRICRDEGDPLACPIGAFLNDLARRRRRLRIHILDWDFPLVFGAAREPPPLYGPGWKPHRRIRFRYDDSQPLACSHHQKLVVIDDRLAFVGGLDFTCRRWDTRAHAPGDPRRRDNGSPYPPLHDVMLALDGPAARALGEVARQRWLKATGDRLPVTEVAEDPWPPALRIDFREVRVAVACTAPPDATAPGVREVEQLFLDMIRAARRYIYMEQQYFTSSAVGDALAARLAEPEGPEVVVVSRLLSHGWLEETTMSTLRAALVRRLRAADAHDRFRICYPHVEGLGEDECVDVRAKLTIVDDQWLRVGSADASNRSMRVDTECDVVIEAAGDASVRERIRGVRDELLAEHLGTDAAAVAARIGARGRLVEAVDTLGTPARRLLPMPDASSWPAAPPGRAGLADPERPVSLDALAAQLASSSTDPRGARAGRWWKLLALALLLLALALSWRVTPLAQAVSPEAVLDAAHAFGERWWAPLLIFLAYTPASVVMFPRPLITLAAVVAFGAWGGFACALGGVLFAALAGYALGRRLSRDSVRRIAGPRLNSLAHALRDRGLIAMTGVRLVPVAPFTVVSLVAGAIRIRVLHFVAGTAIGMLPGILAATVFGSQVEAGLRDPSRIHWPLMGAVALVLLAGAAGVHRWLARIQAHHTPAESPGEGDRR